MKSFWGRLYRAVRRAVPACVGQSQAVAFNMFLAFFPMLLLVLGVLLTSVSTQGGMVDVIGHLRPVLPPGASPVVSEFIHKRGGSAAKWISLGLSGTLLVGTQMMRLLIDGFHMVYGDQERPGFWNKNLRALLLLLVTVAPWVVTAHLIVFGKQMRTLMMAHSAMPLLVRGLWSLVYFGVALGMAMAVLAVVYRVGRPNEKRWMAVVPGAMLATAMWWLVSASFGIYVRHVPYGAIYGGLAVVIGLMVWMQLTATIIFIGAAYNAEAVTAR